MTAITDEIQLLETELHACLDNDDPIDTLKLKRLCSLRVERMKELVEQHAVLLTDRNNRTAIMQEKTRDWVCKLALIKLDAKPDIRERLLVEQDKYDVAAIYWVENESTEWHESEAYFIAAGILVLAGEV